MDQEKNLSEQIKGYEQLAQDNENVDLAALTINALEGQSQNMVSNKLRRWAYLLSIGFPPIGILFAIKFFFDEHDDAKRIGIICLILTAVAIVLLIFFIWIMGNLMLSSAGVSIDQLQQLNVNELKELIQ